jgi:alpha-L-arabinofuranosidase
MVENHAVGTETTAVPAPADAEVRYRMDISFRVAITPFVARQNANVYLLMNVGNMLSAGDPVLSLSDQPHWKVPIYCAFPEFKRREKIGELALDVNSGAILLEHSFPSSPQAIERHVQIIYDSLTTPPAGT